MRSKIATLFTIVLMLAAASALAGGNTNGKRLFNSFSGGKCKMCHNIGAAKKVGPGLAEVVNSEALGAAHDGIRLTPPVIRDIIRNPRSVSSGTRMPRNAVLTDREIKDIVAYLKTL